MAKVSAESSRSGSGAAPSSNRRVPVRTAMGCTSRCSSSSSPAASSWRTTETEPLIPMARSPGSRFRALTASTRSPWSCSELRQVNVRGWRDTTIFRASPMVLAKAASSPPAASRSGQAPAKLS